MPRKNTPEAERWKLLHNRKLHEPKNTLQHLELRTTQEVATILGISRQRVSQIERGALFKLRQRLQPFWEDYCNEKS